MALEDCGDRKRIDRLLRGSILLNQPSIVAKFLEEQLEYVDQLSDTILESDVLLSKLGLDTIGKREELRKIISGTTSTKVEKQKARSAEEIKGLINKVKFERKLAKPSASTSKATNAKQRSVQLSWCHYDKKKERFVPVRSNKGGGCRTVRLSVDADLDTVLQSCRDMFFPEGNSIEHGKWKDMDSAIHNCTGERIEKDQPFSLGAFISATGLRSVRFYLYTRPKKWYDVVLESEQENDAVLVEYNKGDAESAIAEVGKEGTSTKDHEDLDSEDDLPVMISPTHPDHPCEKMLPQLKELQEVVEIPCDLPIDFWEEASPSNIEKSDTPPAVSTAIDVTLEAPTSKQTFTKKEEKEQELLDIAEIKRARRKQLAELLLPEEPRVDEVETLEISVRTSLGSHIRRFRKRSPVQDLYDFVCTLEGIPDDFTLISLFPRNELSETTAQLGELFQTNKEAVYIEIKVNGNVAVLDKFLSQYTDDEVSLFRPHIGIDDRRKTLPGESEVNEDHMEGLEIRRLRCLNFLRGLRTFVVHRDNIVNDFLEAYEKEGMDYSRLTTEFADEEGLDVDGITREAFTLFWDECFYRFFEGSGLYVPRVDPDCTPRLFNTLGRIASHGFVLAKIFPVYVVRSCIMGAIFQEVPENMLLDDFLSHIPEMERTSFQSVLQGSGDIDQAILSCLSLYNVRKIPNGQQLKATILEIARCEFLVKPQAIMREFKRGMFDCNPELWSTVRLEELVTLYENLNVDPAKVSEMVKPSEHDQPLNQAKDRVFNYLNRFLKSCTKKMAIAFLRYCTGSNVVVVPHIEVSFVDVGGLARRPVAHTCTARLDLSTCYESYSSFCHEFSKILTNEDAFRFNAL